MNWKEYFVQGMELLFLGLASYEDLKSKEISMKVFWIFGLLAIGLNFLWKYQNAESAVTGACIGGIFIIIGRISKEAIGYGDGLGIVILGMFAGGYALVKIIFTAAMLCGLYGMWSLLGRRRCVSDTLPFFPFLFIGAIGGVFL